MEAQLVDTLSDGELKAEIFSTELPGEFKVIYRDAANNELEDILLTGISSYKQRETEIRDRLRQLNEGAPLRKTGERGAASEY
ncbi:MAG: hypothetical protein JO211_07995 [Acidobacteriaceae bacterium]|nr:hypothetical protein [Acidobacteriaceae bacterium]